MPWFSKLAPTAFGVASLPSTNARAGPSCKFCSVIMPSFWSPNIWNSRQRSTSEVPYYRRWSISKEQQRILRWSKCRHVTLQAFGMKLTYSRRVSRCCWNKIGGQGEETGRMSTKSQANSQCASTSKPKFNALFFLCFTTISCQRLSIAAAQLLSDICWSSSSSLWLRTSFRSQTYIPADGTPIIYKVNLSFNSNLLRYWLLIPCFVYR